MKETTKKTAQIESPLHKGFASIKEAGIVHVPAYLERETWNGWACPWFTLDTAAAILDACNENAGFEVWESKIEGNRLFIRDVESNGNFEEVRQIEHEGTTLYALGNGAWVWCEA